jgi:hypothetical protein
MAGRLLALFATAVVVVGGAEGVLGARATATNTSLVNTQLAKTQLPCGRDDRERVVDPRPGAPATPLVPQGAMSLTVCSYNGPNATPATPEFGLLGAYRTGDAATIAHLTARLDAIRPTPSGEVFSCPADLGDALILNFHYGSASVAVTVDPTGCNSISSGSIKRLGRDAPVIRQIEQLVQPVALNWATVSGHTRLCGGPITPSGKTRCWTSADHDVSYVEAINSSGRVAATTQLRRGRFRFRIASPGSYTFKLLANRTLNNVVLSRTKATVKAGHTTKIVLLVPVP